LPGDQQSWFGGGCQLADSFLESQGKNRVSATKERGTSMRRTGVLMKNELKAVLQGAVAAQCGSCESADRSYRTPAYGGGAP
jgi:hypothetical protein